MRLCTAPVLPAGDRRCSLAIGQDHEHLAVVLRRRCLFQEGSRQRSERIDHAQRRSLARAPLEDIAEGLTRRSERHLRAQLREGRDDEQREPRAQAELAVDGEVPRKPWPPHTSPDRRLEDDLAETGTELTGLAAGDLVVVALVLVAREARAASLPRQVQYDQRMPQGEHLRPQQRLHHGERPGGDRVGRREDLRKCCLDFESCFVDTRHWDLFRGRSLSRNQISARIRSRFASPST